MTSPIFTITKIGRIEKTIVKNTPAESNQKSDREQNWKSTKKETLSWAGLGSR